MCVCVDSVYVSVNVRRCVDCVYVSVSVRCVCVLTVCT